MANVTIKNDIQAAHLRGVQQGRQDPGEWWASFRRKGDEPTFMISENGEDYLFFVPGENLWYRGQIGEKRGGDAIPSEIPTLIRLGEIYDHSKPAQSAHTSDIFMELFPDGDPYLLKECTELSFRELGVYIAQSAGFTWFLDEEKETFKMTIMMTRDRGGYQV
jgi:hypothetical protein